MQKLIRPAILMVILCLSACYYDNLEEINVGKSGCVVPDTASYQVHIAPIMTSSCGVANSGCHQTSNAANSFVGLTDHAGVVDAVDKGLMDAIHQNGNVNPMPKGGGKLSDCMIETIQRWIDQGMRNN